MFFQQKILSETSFNEFCEGKKLLQVLMNKMNAEGANKVSNTLLSEANETINPN